MSDLDRQALKRETGEALQRASDRLEKKISWFADASSAVGALVGILAIVLALATGPVLSLDFIPQRFFLPIGVGLVVGLGALGLVFRAIGELKASAKWKAAGYLVGAGAYLVTASVSLSSAAHLLPTQ